MPRHLSGRRKSVIVRTPIAYQSATDKSSRSKLNRADSNLTKSRTLSHSRSSSLSRSQVLSETSTIGLVGKSTSRRYPYRYRRSPLGPVPRGHKPQASKKLAFCLAGSVLLVVALIASGLYIYYFIDRNGNDQIDDHFSVVLVSAKPFITVPIENGNESVIFDKDENSTDDAGLIEKIAGDSLEEPKEAMSDKGFYYSEKVCIDDVRNRECVAGSAPEVNTCKQGGFCTRVQYHANVESSGAIFDPEVELRRLDLTMWPAPEGTICRRKSDYRLGVCLGGECGVLYNGTSHNRTEGQWRDNCDRVNPCWTTPDKLQITSRSNCINAPADCNRDDQCANSAAMAVVWLEHRYCYMHPGRAGNYCEGLPFRLWLCRYCRRRVLPVWNGLQLARAFAMDACLQRYNAMSENDSGACIISCNDLSNNVTMGKVIVPDGAVCLVNASHNNIGYCYKGRCFAIEASLYEEQLQTVEECEKQKRAHASS